MSIYRKLSLLCVVASFFVALTFYNLLPSEVASHWNFRGEVDGFLPRFWGAFLMPFVASFMFIIFAFIPKIDPLKKNVEKFKKYYEAFIFILLLFLVYIYLLTIFWNLGARFSLGLFISPAIAVLLYFVGVILDHSKRNWFIGIRTPWTMESDKVWVKTHKLGSKMFKAMAFAPLLGVIFPDLLFPFIFGAIVPSALFLIAYSYFLYQKGP